MKVKDSRYAACRFLIPALLVLFLATMPTPALAQGGVWVQKAPTPTYGGLGEAVVGTGAYVYAIRGAQTGVCKFWRYDLAGNTWAELLSWTPADTPPPDPPRPKSGTALAWDHGDYVYALLGDAYPPSNASRSYFYRYSISTNGWARLADSPHVQGAGDALAWSGYDGFVYAMLGSNGVATGGRRIGVGFARYYSSNNTWKTLAFNPSWTITDDGASLVWTGGEYLYALRGEWEETTPHNDFARYHIPTSTWQNMAGIPVGNGVGDGASLLWVGNWVSQYSNYVFALGGNDVLENPGYGFYRYDISSNAWAQLQNTPYSVGYNVGNRLAFAGGHIYYWQGAASTWDGGGARFYMFSTSASKLVITVNPSSATAGSWTTVYTVQRQDEYGYPVTSNSTTVYLSSTSIGANGKFAETPGGPAVTSVTIPDGSSTKDFYYYDEKAGSWTISVSSTGLTGDGKSLTVNPGSLASFTMSGYPSSVTAGQSFGTNNVVVTAYDVYSNMKVDFAGQVYFTSSDPQAGLPYTSGSKYTFVAGDNGLHTFPGTGFTLKTAGSQTITVTDGSISKASGSIQVNPGVLASFTMTGYPSSVTAGQSFDGSAVLVTAYDPAGNVKTDYIGSVHWTSTDPSATLPADYTFVASEHGAHTFAGTGFVLKTAGSRTITITDGTTSKTSSSITVNLGTLDHIVVSPKSATVAAGGAQAYAAEAFDQFDNSLGDVTASTSWSIDADAGGSWSGNVYTSAKVGTWTVTGTYSGKSDAGSLTVNVGVLDHFVFANIVSPQTAGAAFSITVTAVDAYGNMVTSYTGTNTLDDSTHTISPVSTGAFSAGVKTLSVTITRAQTRVAISTSGGGKSGTSNSFDVNPGALDHFIFDSISSPQTAGAGFSVTITAKDQWGNTVPSYGGTPTLSASTGSGTIEPTVTDPFSSGAWSGTVTLTKAQSGVSITATDGAVSGTSGPFDGNPAALDHFAFASISSPKTAGVSFSITITAEDAHGNTVTTYVGTNSLSDSTGTLESVTTGAFTGGVWSGSVTITKAQVGVTISTTGDSKTGESNAFTVSPAELNRFVFDAIGSPQTAGASFHISITAQDEYGNTVTGYADSNTLSDTTATVTPGTTGAFTSGAWSGDVTITKAQLDVKITTSGDSKSGETNSFTVNTAVLDHIAVSPDPKTVAAGESVTYTAVAYDAYGNSLSDVTTSTTWSIQSGASGSWSANVYTSAKSGTWTVTGTYSGKSDDATLTVNAASLDHFTFVTISSPQTAGSAFNITITAKDAYENTVISYTGTNSLSDSTGTISPPSTSAFTAGVWTGNVTITSLMTGDMISTSGDGNLGTSNAFDVVAGAVQHFVFDSIGSPQTAGVSFSITITAKDAYGNTVTTYTGTNTLSDLTGTISPMSVGPFASGVWSGSVTITKAQTGVAITTTGGGESGMSNRFDVNSASACVATATGTGAGCLSPDGGVITTLTAVSESSFPIEGKPNIVFPHGFFSFRITILTLGTKVTVTITLPSPVPVGTQYWKYGPTPDNHTPHWYQLPIGDDDGDNVITITLTDNGLGDDILTGQDGQIVDQGGPGIQRGPGPTGEPSGGTVPELPATEVTLPIVLALVSMSCYLSTRAHRKQKE